MTYKKSYCWLQYDLYLKAITEQMKIFIDFNHHLNKIDFTHLNLQTAVQLSFNKATRSSTF